MLGEEKYFCIKSITDDSPYSDVSNSAYEIGGEGSLYKFLGPGDFEGNPGHDHVAHGFVFLRSIIIRRLHELGL